MKLDPCFVWTIFWEQWEQKWDQIVMQETVLTWSFRENLLGAYDINQKCPKILVLTPEQSLAGQIQRPWK